MAHLVGMRREPLQLSAAGRVDAVDLPILTAHEDPALQQPQPDRCDVALDDVVVDAEPLTT